jgi:hypothetical protein
VCGRSSDSVVQVLPGVGSVRRLPEQPDPSHRSLERLVNQAVLVLNNSHQGDAVLRSMFEINKNFNSLNRKVDQIAGRIEKKNRPKEVYDPMNELEVRALKNFASLRTCYRLIKKCVALAKII